MFSLQTFMFNFFIDVHPSLTPSNIIYSTLLGYFLVVTHDLTTQTLNDSPRKDILKPKFLAQENLSNVKMRDEQGKRFRDSKITFKSGFVTV